MNDDGVRGANRETETFGQVVVWIVAVVIVLAAIVAVGGGGK